MFDNIIRSCISMFYICLLQMFFVHGFNIKNTLYNMFVKNLHKAVMKY